MKWYNQGLELINVIRYEELTLIKEINLLPELQFETDEKLKNEDIIEYKDHYYTVKETDSNSKGIICIYNIDDFLVYYIRDLPMITETVSAMVNKIKPSGWTVIVEGSLLDKRTVTINESNAFEALKEIVDTFGVEYKLDNKNKTITISAQLGNDKGVYYIDDINLSEINVNSDSYEFYTRIIPQGKNGLRITAINDGVDYLDNNQYSNKIITQYWEDNRFTNIQNLKETALKRLAIASTPLKVFEAQVIDLSNVSGYEIFDYDVGDTVTVITADERLKQRILKVEEHEEEFENKVTLANRPYTLENIHNDIENKIADNWEQTLVELEKTDNSIVQAITTSKNYTDDSFITYKSERIQTDDEIRETISEKTTYIDPITGETKPIIQRMSEQVQDLEGFKTSVEEYKSETNNKFSQVNQSVDQVEIRVSENYEKKIIKSNTAPLNPVIGDLWLDTSVTPNFIKRYDGNKWVASGVTTAEQLDAYTKSEADSKISQSATAIESSVSLKYEGKVYKQNTAPAGVPIGTLWVNTSSVPNMLQRWNGSSWVDTSITTPAQIGAYAKIETDSKISQSADSIISTVSSSYEPRVYKQTTTPSGTIPTGALWVNTSRTPNVISRWSGSSWIKTSATDVSEITNAATSSQITQLSNSINLKVDKSGIINQINLDKSGVKINASQITLAGAAITLDGNTIVTSGFSLNAARIVGGTIKSSNGYSWLNLVDGTFKFGNTTLTKYSTPRDGYTEYLIVNGGLEASVIYTDSFSFSGDLTSSTSWFHMEHNTTKKRFLSAYDDGRIYVHGQPIFFDQYGDTRVYIGHKPMWSGNYHLIVYGNLAVTGDIKAGGGIYPGK